MFSAVFGSTFRILARPAFGIPAIFVAAAVDAAIRLNGWPTANLDTWPRERQMTIAIVVLLARGWLDLTLIAVGIAIARGQPAGLLRQWVHVLTALKIGAIGVVMLAGIVLGALVVVIPGVYLMLRWSQVLPSLVEGRTRVSDAMMYSETIASAHYLRILVIWALAWGVPALAAYAVRHFVSLDVWPNAVAIETLSDVAWSAVLHAFGLALIAALYVELDSRAYVKTRP